ncbi:RmlC-like cupins superfamily protein [Tanacetum coccineum]
MLLFMNISSPFTPLHLTLHPNFISPNTFYPPPPNTTPTHPNTLISTQSTPSTTPDTNPHTSPNISQSTHSSDTSSTSTNPSQSSTSPTSSTAIPTFDTSSSEDFILTTTSSTPSSTSHSPAPPPLLPRKSQRTKATPTKLKDFHHYKPSSINFTTSKHHTSYFINYKNIHNPHTLHLINSIHLETELISYTQASKHPKWVEAINNEISALESNHTWELTTLPPFKHPIGYKWVYRIKYNANGSVDKYKARLVAKGFNQNEGINYTKTFAPVGKMVIVRIVLEISSINNWFVHQLDVNNAFLYGDLNEEVYMAVPSGYKKSLPPNIVCILKKSLYGLKQANKQRFIKLTTLLIYAGFTQSHADSSLFTYYKDKDALILLIYVDDILVAGNNLSLIKDKNDQLHQTFTIKDLGPLHYYLGIEFLRNTNCLVMTQKKYALDLIEFAKLENDKPAKTPLDSTIKLTYTAGEPLSDPSHYRTLVSKLIYLTISIPDVAFAAQLLSQFSHNPHTSHLEALNRVIRYLKLSLGQGLYFPKNNPLTLHAYYDSD